MELSELSAYAREAYQIEEQHKWNGFPGFSVLSHPRTGKWVALLMRQWDTESGEEIQRCDLKCGIRTLAEYRVPYLAPPLRMKGPKWISVAFVDETDPELVFRLFDRAVVAGEEQGFTMVLNQPSRPEIRIHRDSPLPLPPRPIRPPEVLPERLRQMKHLYEYGSGSMEARAANFLRQGRFMADFQDEAGWADMAYVSRFPTYHDLTTRQLRGYFAWRTHVRQGDYQPVAASAVYIYLYELLNLIGADSPEDALRKLKAFETGYLDAGYGDAPMRSSLRRWMTDLAVVHALGDEVVRRYADPALLQRDHALAVLRSPFDRADGEVFSALCFFDGKRLAQSPVCRQSPERGARLFSEVWRLALRQSREGGRDLFTLCFGEQTARAWYPFAGAVYCWERKPADGDYPLDACRSYRCRDGVWTMLAWEDLSLNRPLLHGLLRQTDLMLRRYLKTGGYLREKPEDAWISPCVRSVVEAEKREAAEKARPRISLDLSGLERIRRDALITRDSLLTDEERAETEGEAPAPEQATAEAEAPAPEQATPPRGASPELPLDEVQLEILRALLDGKPASGILRAHRLMPDMTADILNEAMYDEIGDSVVECENDTLSLVEDYREDLTRLLGGDH